MAHARRDTARFAACALAGTLAWGIGPDCSIARADSDVIDFGNEFEIGVGHEVGPDPAAFGTDGGATIVWGLPASPSVPDPDPSPILGQRLDPAGNLLGTEFQINTSTGVLGDASIASLQDGSFVAVWTRRITFVDQDVVGRRIDAAGVAAGAEFVVNGYTSGIQYRPVVDALDDGSFVVVWVDRSQYGGDAAVLGRRFDVSAAPLGPEQRLDDSGPQHSDSPGVTATDDGFAVSWTHDSGVLGSETDARVRRFDIAGVPLAPSFSVHPEIDESERFSHIARRSDGVVVSWTAFTQTAQGVARVRTFDATGAPLTGVVETADLDLTSRHSDLHVEPDDTFLLAYRFQRFPGTDTLEMEHLDASAVSLAPRIQLNTTEDEFTFSPDPRVSGDGQGRLISAWSSFTTGVGKRILGQRLVRHGALPSPCAATPDTGCRQPGSRGASIKISDRDFAGKDALNWKLRRGGAATFADFLDPVDSLSLRSLCIYDASASAQPVKELKVAPGGRCRANRPCWRPKGDSGVTFKDRELRQGGVGTISLRAGDEGKTRLDVKGKGERLEPPTLPLTFPVVIQYVTENTTQRECWETTFSTATRNVSALLKAKSD